MHYNKMKRAVGIFVFLFLVSFGIFLYLLLDAKGFFEKRYSYYFLTDSASSLSIGMPVKFSGFAIGAIDSIELLDDGHVKAVFSVGEKNRKWINPYTYLLLKRPLLGAPHIEVLATANNGFLQPGSRVPLIVTDDINDLVTKFEPVVDKLLHIIENVETITATMADKNSSLNKTMSNLERFSAKLANDDSLITTFTGDANATKEVIDSIRQSKEIVRNIANITASVDARLIEPTSASLHTLNAILEDLLHKLQTLQPLVLSLGKSDKSITQLQENMQITIEKTNAIMEKIDALIQKNEEKEVELP